MPGLLENIETKGLDQVKKEIKDFFDNKFNPEELKRIEKEVEEEVQEFKQRMIVDESAYRTPITI